MLIFDQLKKNDVYLRALTLVVLGGMFVLLGGLYFVQIVSSQQHAENQIAQSFRTVRIPAARGKILDRHGQSLAENQPSYTAGVYLEELRDSFKEEWRLSKPKERVNQARRLTLESQARYRVVSNIAHQLSQVLNQPIELDHETFRKHYRGQLALPLPLLSNLDAAEVARFQETPFHAPGLNLVVEPYRFYPHGPTASHTLGYLTRDDSSAEDELAFFNYRLPDYRGRVGIERTFDEQLRGRAGVKSMLVNSMGYRQSENVWEQADPGKNVYLTLDLTIQKAAEEALATASSATRSHDVRGAAVVMDPHSGDLLALASLPSFDPNQFIPKISQEDYDKLLDPYFRPQINRCLQENYAPGSIFKIVVGLACLQEGLDPHQVIYNPGHIRLGRRYINDTAKPGEYDFRKAFLKSSNTYFITNGLNAGIQSILRLGRQLHLGELTGIPTAQETSGRLPTDREVKIGWTAGDTANLCIGQGPIDVTPLQMAVMTAAIANGGQVLWPRLVDRMEPAVLHSPEEKTRFPSGRVRNQLEVSPQAMRIIQEAMLADVEDEGGTGRAAGLPGLRVCGKTGTAQVEKRTDDGQRYIDQTVWFVSYAPFENPRYVVVVMVESGLSGGGTCAPVARKIYQALLANEESLQLAASPERKSP